MKTPVLLSLVFCLKMNLLSVQNKQHLEQVKTESLFFSGLWPLLSTQNPKEGYVLQCVFRKA